MEGNPVLLWIVGAAIVIALVVAIYLVLAYFWNWWPFKASGESMVDMNEPSTEQQTRNFNYGVKPLYDGLEVLVTRLNQATTVGTMQNHVNVGELVGHLNEVRNHAQQNGYHLPTNIHGRMKNLEAKLQEHQWSQAPGQFSGTIEYYKLQTMISELKCAAEGYLKSMLSLADIFGEDGKTMMTQAQRVRLLESGTAGFTAGLGTAGISEPVMKALGDVVDFQPIPLQEQAQAEYTDSIYHIAKKDPEMEKRHVDSVNARAKAGNCTNHVGRTRVIEEEVMRSGWSGRMPRIRTCSNGAGPWTTQDAPNTALKASAVLQTGPYESVYGACNKCYNYDATAGGGCC